MAPAEDASKKTMAQRRRDLIFIDRSKTLKLLESSEWGRAQIAATEHRLRPGMTRLESAEWSTSEQWKAALKAASYVTMPGIVRTTQGLEGMFLPREEVSASCESFPDGSGLVIVSDALSTLVWRLSVFNGAWRGNGGLRSRLNRRRKVRDAHRNPKLVADDHFVKAATAALRYSIQHIRTWVTSAAIGLHKENAGLRDGVFAAAFIHAHEIGHFMLGHGDKQNLTSSVINEFEADEFATRALMAQYGKLDPIAVGAGALIALCALQIWESAALIRDVREHPPLRDRWMAVAKLLGSSSEEAEAHTHAARMMSAEASDQGTIPAVNWDALRADPDYEIVHGLPYLLMIEGFDRTESMSEAECDELIREIAKASPRFIEGWETLKSQGWAEAYLRWKIPQDSLLDSAKSLTYLQVVRQIVSAPVWEDTSDVRRRTCALLAIHSRSRELKEAL